MHRPSVVDGIVHEEGGNFSCREELANRVAQLYGDERLSDVTFVVTSTSGAQQRFVGHRNIISVWSSPLDRMLCGSFAEGFSKEVMIRDVEPHAFQVLLQLMYCGKAEINLDSVMAVLDVSARFDVGPLVEFCIECLQKHTDSDHACMMLEVGVRYGLAKLIDKSVELIVTDGRILASDEFCRLSQDAVIALARHDSWNCHEDDIYDTMLKWGFAQGNDEETRQTILAPVLDHVRYPYMSVDKLKHLVSTNEVPKDLILDALFFKLHPCEESDQQSGRYKRRTGSLLFSWVPTSKVTVSGDFRENARHTSANGFTGVRGDRRMQYGTYSWTIVICETQSSWIFVGVARADDERDVAWRASGYMLYCLDCRFFHTGSGQNHPCGDRKIVSGDRIHVNLDLTQHTLAFSINDEAEHTLFQDLGPGPYVPAVDMRDCGDKVRILANDEKVSARAPSGAAPTAPTEVRRHTVPSVLRGGGLLSAPTTPVAAPSVGAGRGSASTPVTPVLTNLAGAVSSNTNATIPRSPFQSPPFPATLPAMMMQSGQHQYDAHVSRRSFPACYPVPAAQRVIDSENHTYGPRLVLPGDHHSANIFQGVVIETAGSGSESSHEATVEIFRAVDPPQESVAESLVQPPTPSSPETDA